MMAHGKREGTRSRRSSRRFRLSSAARTLSPRDIDRLTDEKVVALFEKVRFHENGGKPYCPDCGVDAVYRYRCRAEFKCKACEKRFSLTSGTLFHSRKMSLRDILYAIADFSLTSQGTAAASSMLRWDRSYKTAYVLQQKLRDAMASIQSENVLTGIVEIDGVCVGGYIRQKNMLDERSTNQHRAIRAKERWIVTMRERRRGGRSRSYVFKTERDAIQTVFETVQPSAHIVTDAGDSWHRFALVFDEASMVNHSLGHSIDGVHINGVENQHSRIRRAERGVYLTMNKAHAQRYADELSWRDDHRETDTGRMFMVLAKRATTLRKSSAWVGYWRCRAFRRARNAALLANGSAGPGKSTALPSPSR